MKKFKNLSVFLECSTGSTPKVETIKKYIDVISKMGYNELYLGCTDAYKIEGEPYFNYKRGGYTTKDFQEMDAYAKERGIELIASIQTLAHLHFLQRHDCYADMMDTDNILMVGDERVYALVDKMFATISKGLTSRRIHIGYDEAYGLGTGRYLQKNGPADKKELLLRHLNRVVEIARKYGYACEVWADMLMETDATKVTAEDVKNLLPNNTKVIMWNYCEDREEVLRENIQTLKKHADDVAYAGAVWKICGFGPNLSYSNHNILAQMQACEKEAVEHYIVTLWSDNGAWCSIWSALPSLFLISEYANGAYRLGEEIDKEKFYRITGVLYDDMYSLQYLNDPFKKEALVLGNRSYWILMSDILLCNYDLILSEGTGKAYAALAQEYAKVNGGEYAHLFTMASGIADILAYKAELGVRLRRAYREKDRNTLLDCLTQFSILKEKMKTFIGIFNSYWCVDNMAYGVEVNQLFLGGQVARYEYIENVVREYIERNETIEELETETLMPSLIPQPGEDKCLQFNYRWLISYCGI